jgi:hypothetical protein
VQATRLSSSCLQTGVEGHGACPRLVAFDGVRLYCASHHDTVYSFQQSFKEIVLLGIPATILPLTHFTPTTIATVHHLSSRVIASNPTNR